LVKLFIEINSELLEVSCLFIYLHVLVHEVNENGVLSVCGAILHVVQLEVILQLLIEEALELVSVIEGVESVLEHSKNLVRPELEDLLFVFIEVLVCLVESLEYL